MTISAIQHDQAVQLETIPLSVGSLIATLIDGRPLIIFRPVVEAIGLAYAAQLAKLKTRSWANRVDIATVAADGKTRLMIAVDVPTFLMWLATVNENKVSPEIKPLLQAYQRETQDVVFKYFSQGMAPINPRVAPEQVSAVVDQALGDYRSARERLIAEDEAERAALARVSQGQLQLLGSAVALGLIDSQWGQTKAQVIIARGLGEVPAIPQDELPLYVEEFMRSKQVPRVKVGRFSGAFGKKVLDRAAADGVAIPGKRNQELPDGSIREVTAWTREHLPVFERAWAASYANDVRLKA